MHLILGGTGHVGSAVARALMAAGEPVTIVTREAAKAAHWRGKGAELVQQDIRDRDGLRALFRRARRAFLLNPPAEPSTDTDAVERRTVADILAALDGSGLEMVVAQSTMGARPGGPCGDLNVLHELERGLAAQPIPARVVRAAYHFSNWDGAIETARKEGAVDSALPPDRPLPMVAPEDVGRRCAELLRGPVGRSTEAVEGPVRLTVEQVATAIGRCAGRPVAIHQAQPDDLEAWFAKAGFSEPAAASYACMTRTLWTGPVDEDGPVHRGRTTFEAYLAGR